MNDSEYPKYSSKEQIPGVYKITHVVTDMFYIGSSKDLGSRRITNESALRNFSHKNPNLQELYNFDHELKFEVLELVDKGENVFDREQVYLDKHKDDVGLLNVATDAVASFRGRNHSPEHLAVLANCARNRVDTPETTERKRNAQLGKVLSDEHRENIRRSVNHPDVISKIKAANTGRKLSPERIAAITEYSRNNKQTIEKMNEASSHPITIDGVQYKSLREASRLLGIPRYKLSQQG